MNAVKIFTLITVALPVGSALALLGVIVFDVVRDRLGRSEEPGGKA